jgi:8-oxo-dGTP diphosphatase
MELWDLYALDGKPLNRTAYRGSCLEYGEFHLVVQIWVRDRTGRYLIQRCAEHIEILPGVWATTAGSVLAGSESRAGAVRELFEEMGISAVASELICVFQRTSGDSLESAWILESDIDMNNSRRGSCCIMG